MNLPSVFRVEPSGACNLKCIHCPTGVLGGNGIMSEEVFDKVFGEMERIKPDIVYLYFGGEPFLNKDIFSMVRRIKALGATIMIVTNGMLLTDSMLHEIVDSGLDEIGFSTAGDSPEENDEIRVGSDYQKVAATIERLIEIRGDAPKIQISNCQLTYPLSGRVPDFLKDEFGEYCGVTLNVHGALRWPGLPLNGFRVSERFLEYNHCERLLTDIGIRWNGDVVPCCFDITSSYVIGNIMESSIDELWHNARYEKLRASIREREYLPLCQDCYLVKPGRFMTRVKG